MSSIRLGLTQNLRAEQRLVQSPQMIQAMQILQTPLLELTDREMVELGAQLDSPFELSWTCFLGGDPGVPAAQRRPCRMCDGCKRRKAAFEGAGMVDTGEKPVAMARS